MKNIDIKVPHDVPKKMHKQYLHNYSDLTKGSGRLMLFAGDQKVEHLNNDFHGKGIHPDDADPEHLFRIASKGKIGVFAAQPGLIARYGMDYPKVPYLLKVNSKTNLLKSDEDDPFSNQWLTTEQIIDFALNSGLRILGVGYTIYLGSRYEAEMLKEAAQLIYEAHHNGLITVLWMYPRGKSITDEKDPKLIAGATGVAACLGSDFVKVSYPQKKGANSADILKEAIQAAGRTKVVCAGGSSQEPKAFLQTLHNQIHIAGAGGNATGRNIHQKSLSEAIRMCNAIYSITIEGMSIEHAISIYNGK